MQKFLVGMCYHEPEAWALHQRGIIEDFESSTGLFVEAPTPQEAAMWGEAVACELLRYANNDSSLDWAALGYTCWIETDPQSSGWAHCLPFFQCVRVGEMPDLTQMDTPAYTKWATAHGIKY
ncbi:MAG TPA: hypothetical protein VFE47_21090 [Tepidisphaeraceae bacterium]|jgi:hypothetical protein|nr:hypothetical protein [Tepidisphaeraceae bacterium]